MLNMQEYDLVFGAKRPGVLSPLRVPRDPLSTRSAYWNKGAAAGQRRVHRFETTKEKENSDD
jgi:hypothetical protein